MQMIGAVLFGANEQVAAYVAGKIGDGATFGTCTALGVIRKGMLVGGVVYHELRGHDVRVSIALEGAGFVPWRTLFAYPFEGLKVSRLTSIIDKKNRKSRKLCERLGFQLEGVHPRAIDGSPSVALSYGMLKEHCRWIKEKSDGKT